MSKEVPGQNRGFGFLEFYNHTCANAAKGVLSAPTYRYLPPVLHGVATHAEQHRVITLPTCCCLSLALTV